MTVLSNRHPGKFEGNQDQELAARLYDISLYGCCESIGDVESFGFYTLIIDDGKGYIGYEDSQGFWTIMEYESVKDAEDNFARISSEYDDFMAEAEV
jgi:hypothetical protein